MDGEASFPFSDLTQDYAASNVAGVDEVGRGPLAGPVVACAVLCPDPNDLPSEVSDSKKLSPSKRETLAHTLTQDSSTVEVGIGIVSPSEIDRLNIRHATHSAMRRALEHLGSKCRFALVDGLPVEGLPVPSKSLVKGDDKDKRIAAASIIAKVRRDHIMEELDSVYPAYGFAKHKGYGTAEHLWELDQHGASPVHRKSFAPVRKVCTQRNYHQPDLNKE